MGYLICEIEVMTFFWFADFPRWMIARAGMAPETEDGRRWRQIAANSSHASTAARAGHGTVRRRLLSDGYFAGDFGSIYDHRHKPEQMAPSVAMSAGEPQKQAPTCANDAADHCYHTLPRASLPQVLATQIASFSCRES